MTMGTFMLPNELILLSE